MGLSEVKAYVATNLVMLLSAACACLLVLLVIAAFWIRALHAEAGVHEANFAACKDSNRTFAETAKTNNLTIDALRADGEAWKKLALTAGDAERARAAGLRAGLAANPIAPLAPGADACVAARALVEAHRQTRAAR